MNKFNEAVSRIKILECPTGDLESRVAGIFADYGVADISKVKVRRKENLDSAQAQAYQVDIAGEGQSLVVLAESGYDDYVAKVVEVYNR